METVAKKKPNIEVVLDAENLASRCVDLFVCDAAKSIKAKGVFRVAISGGHTPQRFFELLGEMPEALALDWEKIQLFWVDERYVPVDSQWSNYKLAADTFINKVPIHPDNVHRIPTESSDFKIAAAAYEQTITNVFDLEPGHLPQFDMVVLGMGVEGHTGSLFPNSFASLDKEDLVCVVYVLDEKLNRITLTAPVICAADHVAVLVSGSEKAAILKEVMSSEPDEVKYPIHILWPILDRVTWLVDNAAAQQL